MKRILLLTLLLVITIFFLSAKSAKAQGNNIFGVHILFPEEVPLAAELVNSAGGDWGYVVIPIQATDRNHEKWQKFMDDCRDNNLIPIIRLATYPIGSNWAKPNEFDSLDWANFLNDLNWPTKKKIVAVYNEPNHASEWGGVVDPFEYSDVLSDTINQFKKVNDNFIMLNAAFDASSANSGSSMDEYEFMATMMLENPDIFRKIDGFNAHSYPNPNFSGNPSVDTRFSIKSYQHEISYLQDYYGIYGLDVYITETGWKRKTFSSDEQIGAFYKFAFSEVWSDSYIKVVSPFLLKADAGDFKNFSLVDSSTKTAVFDSISKIPKTRGTPELEKKEDGNVKNQESIKKAVNYIEKVNEETFKFKSTWKKIINWIFK